MIITGTSVGETLYDIGNRDKMTGGDGADIFALMRDNKRDFILDFTDGVDKIDLTAFAVTFDEVMIRMISADTFEFNIRGESNTVTFAPTGTAIGLDSLGVDDFIFAPGAAPPSTNFISDTAVVDRLYGTSRPDVFHLSPDGTRDAVRKFELGKDKINIQTFDTNFGELVFVDVKPGRVRVEITTDSGVESIVIVDGSHMFTGADFSVGDFIF
jgi:hypothetical protein